MVRIHWGVLILKQDYQSLYRICTGGQLKKNVPVLVQYFVSPFLYLYVPDELILYILPVLLLVI